MTNEKLNIGKIEIQRKIRVAIYDRIPVSGVCTPESYEAVLSQHEDWFVVGIYIDKGKSGMNIESRDALKRMITDVEQGKIDLIVARSFACFSRNRMDYVYLTCICFDHAVDIYFVAEDTFASKYINTTTLL